MPTIKPKENWLKTGRWDAVDDLHKAKDSSVREMAPGGKNRNLENIKIN